MQHLIKRTGGFGLIQQPRILAALLVVGALVGCSQSSEPDVRSQGEATGTGPTEATPAQRVSSAPSSASQADASVATLEYQCAPGPACSADPLGAKDKEEAQWLSINGYPSSDQLRQFKALSDDQLKQRADAGSLAAMTVYGERKVAQGDTKQGIQYVHDAIRNGSIYGYYAMSSIYRNTAGLKNNVDAAAYLRVAYILGDAKASAEMNRRFDDLSVIERVAIDERATALYRSFAGSKQPNPRP